jgi:hypothetical protein
MLIPLCRSNDAAGYFEFIVDNFPTYAVSATTDNSTGYHASYYASFLAQILPDRSDVGCIHLCLPIEKEDGVKNKLLFS